MDEVLIEIREPGKAPRTVPVTGTVEIGRECNGVLIGDESASRRHVALTAAPGGVSVVDLGSSNGTYVNGVRMSAEPQVVRAGDVVVFGGTELRLAELAPAPPPPQAEAPGQPGPEAAAEAAAARGAVSFSGRLARRLEAAHAWADLETGGIGWADFVEAVVETGLDDLTAVIRRIGGGRSAPRGAG